MSDVIVSVLVFIHFLGLAVLIGGLMVQATPDLKVGRTLAIVGAAVQLATGIGLLAILMGDVNHVKATVKFVITAVILVLVLLRRTKPLRRSVWLTSIALCVTNVGLAVFW